jgi:hypothetical protein
MVLYFGIKARFNPMTRTGRIQKTYQVGARFSSSTISLTEWEAGYHTRRTKRMQKRLYRIPKVEKPENARCPEPKFNIAEAALERLLKQEKTAQTAR